MQLADGARSSRRKPSAKPLKAPPSTPPEWMTCKQTCAHLQISDKTLKRWRALGKGPPFSRFGDREIRYSRKNVDTWLETRAGASDEDFDTYRPSVVRTRR